MKVRDLWLNDGHKGVFLRVIFHVISVFNPDLVIVLGAGNQPG
jgi:hypothetical protein